MTVDGGTNKLHRFIKQNELENLKHPDFITGDMDSADSVIIKQFISAGSQVIHTPNQNETDFYKALIEVKKYCTGKIHTI